MQSCWQITSNHLRKQSGINQFAPSTPQAQPWPMALFPVVIDSTTWWPASQNTQHIHAFGVTDCASGQSSTTSDAAQDSTAGSMRRAVASMPLQDRQAHVAVCRLRDCAPCPRPVLHTAQLCTMQKTRRAEVPTNRLHITRTACVCEMWGCAFVCCGGMLTPSAF